MAICFVYLTCPDRDTAARIASTLVQERLIACANILEGMTALYEWQGQIRQDSETILIVKTRQELVPEVTQRVRSLHTYTCPCVAAWPITGGSDEFCRWIEMQTTEPATP